LLAGEKLLTGRIKSKCPHIFAAKRLAHRSANQTLGARDSYFTKRVNRLDERLKKGQEEVVWTSEAESCVHRIVTCGLLYLGFGQVPHRIRGGTQLGRVASGRVRSLIVDIASDDRNVGYFAGFEELGDGV
jgi:hypothetical protein